MFCASFESALYGAKASLQDTRVVSSGCPLLPVSSKIAPKQLRVAYKLQNQNAVLRRGLLCRVNLIWPLGSPRPKTSMRSQRNHKSRRRLPFTRARRVLIDCPCGLRFTRRRVAETAKSFVCGTTAHTASSLNLFFVILSRCCRRWTAEIS